MSNLHVEMSHWVGGVILTWKSTVFMSRFCESSSHPPCVRPIRFAAIHARPQVVGETAVNCTHSYMSFDCIEYWHIIQHYHESCYLGGGSFIGTQRKHKGRGWWGSYRNSRRGFDQMVLRRTSHDELRTHQQITYSRTTVIPAESGSHNANPSQGR